MDKIKQIWGFVVAGVVGIIGLMLFIFTRKNPEVEELKTKAALANTQKEADLVEVQVKILKTDQNNLAKHNEQLDKVLETVENRRVEIKEEQKNLKDPKQVAQYWDKN